MTDEHMLKSFIDLPSDVVQSEAQSEKRKIFKGRADLGAFGTMSGAIKTYRAACQGHMRQGT